jgi:hypothetical protein
MTIAPLLTFFLKISSKSGLIFLERDVKFIIPSDNAELKKGLDLTYSLTA